MFGRYVLPSNNAARQGTSATASDPMDGYPAEYILPVSNTGHLNLPSRPAKLDALQGYFEGTIPSSVIVGAAFAYHNLDENLDVTIELDGAFSQAFTIPAKPDPDDDWTINPWVEFDAPQTTANWRLAINEDNSQNVQVGQIWLITEFSRLETDVRYGGELAEDRLILRDQTVLGIENLYDMYGVRRRFAGEFGFSDTETAALLALWRAARTRVLPWLLIPNEDINDAWLVRFDDDAYSRVFDTIGFNSHPFRVRELARGMPWR